MMTLGPCPSEVTANWSLLGGGDMESPIHLAWS